VVRWEAKARAEKVNKLNPKFDKSKPKLRQAKSRRKIFQNDSYYLNFKIISDATFLSSNARATFMLEKPLWHRALVECLKQDCVRDSDRQTRVSTFIIKCWTLRLTFKTGYKIDQNNQTTTQTTQTWPVRGLVVSASASVLVASYQDHLTWYCSLLTRRTVRGWAAGNTRWTHTKNEIVQTQSWRYKTIVVIKHQQKPPYQKTATKAAKTFFTNKSHGVMQA